MENRARVVRYVSQGSLEMARAIESGMVSADVKNMCEAVLQENKRISEKLESANRELRHTKELLKVEREINRNNASMRIEAYKRVFDDDSDFRRRKDFRLTLYTAMFAVGVLISSLCIVIGACRM